MTKEIPDAIRLWWARLVAYRFPFVGHVLRRREVLFLRSAESIYLHKKGSVILEVGTGSGRLPIILGKMDLPQYYLGVDLCMILLNNARQTAEKEMVNSRVSFSAADVQDLPLRDGTVDVVVSIASLHQWHDRKRGLVELHRVLKNRGSMIILVNPVLMWVFDLFKGRVNNPRDMKKILRKIGFREVFTESVMIDKPEPGRDLLFIFATK